MTTGDVTPEEVVAVYGPRAAVQSCWCAHFLRCDGINVPGFRGGGHAELCLACEVARLAAATRAGAFVPATAESA